MKCGILQCDQVNQEFRNIAGDYPDMFKSLFRLIDHDMEFITFPVYQQDIPLSPFDMDCFITTGSRHSVYEDIPWIKKFEKLIQDIHQSRVPLVGICFGHQMIAHALGGRVAKSDVGWGAGVKTIDVVKQQPWMEPSMEKYTLQVMHQDQVMNLPPGAHLLASSDYCPNFMFQLGETTLGLQAHPEFEKEYTEALIRSRVVRIGEKASEEALAGIDTPLDRKAMAGWLYRFMKGKV